jgi:hypothetical protein
MKKFTLILIMTFSYSIAYSAIITVDNKTPSIGQYKTLQDANDAANDGDTLYVCPSESVYPAAIINKKLTIIGTGHSRPGERLSTTTISGSMQFDEGAEGSALKGFGGYFAVIINSDDITIQKNRIKTIAVNENHKGTAILQNYINYSSDKITLLKINNQTFPRYLGTTS